MQMRRLTKSEIKEKEKYEEKKLAVHCSHMHSLVQLDLNVVKIFAISFACRLSVVENGRVYDVRCVRPMHTQYDVSQGNK